MQTQSSNSAIDNVINSLWSNSVIKGAFLVLFGSLMLGMTAHAKIALWPSPVPITLQTLVLFTMAATYGWRLAGLTVIAYWIEGIMGLPMFANSALALPFTTNLLYFAGGSMTAGFLWGFLPAALIVGWVSEQSWGKNWISLFVSMLVASIPLYVLGLAVGSFYIGTADWLTTSADLFKYFLTLFIIGDLVKMALATFLILKPQGFFGKN